MGSTNILSLVLLVTVCGQFRPATAAALNCSERCANKKYDYVVLQVSWENAVFACQQKDPHYFPASIITQREDILMAGQIAELLRDSSWTSGRRYTAGGPFVWTTTNAQFTYTHWRDGIEPSPSEVGCVYLEGSDQGIVWKVGDCSQNRYVVCERCLDGTLDQ